MPGSPMSCRPSSLRSNQTVSPRAVPGAHAAPMRITSLVAAQPLSSVYDRLYVMVPADTGSNIGLAAVGSSRSVVGDHIKLVPLTGPGSSTSFPSQAGTVAVPTIS